MTHAISPQDQFGAKLAAQLSLAANELPHDISERLRVARVRAVGARLQAQTQPNVVAVASHGAALLGFGGDEGLSLWNRLASFLPLIALVLGLVAIQQIMDDDRANELAEVDVALLTDDLPPEAYADPGFLQFLKTPVSSDSSN